MKNLSQNRTFSLVFRCAALVFAIIGVMSQMGFFRGEIGASSLMYYTIQSNLLAVVLFGMLTVRTMMGLRESATGDNGWFARFEMVCTVNILLTFIVFWTLLAGELSAEYLWSFDNMAVHTITPLLCLADYLMFGRGGKLKRTDILCTCIYPLFYTAFSAAAGLLGYVYFFAATFENDNPVTSIVEMDFEPVRAPYFFLDYWSIGAWTAVYIAVILVFLILLGWGFYALDRRAVRN